MSAPKLVVGVLSDTHGYLYPSVKQMLAGVDRIVHAGDIGSPQVLEELRCIAPVTAVRGNCDLDAWALSLPERAVLELGGARILVAHSAADLREIVTRPGAAAGPGPAAGPTTVSGPGAAADPRAAVQASLEAGSPGAAAGYDVVISGHSHRPGLETRDGVLHLNPGAAGPRRFGRPRTLARLEIDPLAISSGNGAVRSRGAASTLEVRAEIIVVEDGS